MPARDDIDPKLVNVAERKQRKRRRVAPEPSAQLLAGKERARKRAMSRPLSPGVLFEPKGDGYQITAPHSDLDLWELQIADAFGTRSQSIMRTFLSQLKALVPTFWDQTANRIKPNETELNAALAMVADVQPRNVREAALAAQMVATHWMQMRVSAAALNHGGMVLEREAGIAGKLARTFAMQLETLQKIRGRNRTAKQSIKVKKETHQHVHYHDHRGADETEGQSHERKPRIVDQRSAVRCQDEGGEVVPLPRRQRP